MVSIRKAKQGFARRQRGGDSPAAAINRFISSVINGKEPMDRIIAAGVGFVTLFAFYWLFTVPAADGSGSGGGGGILGRQRRFRPQKMHPVMTDAKTGARLGDRFDTFAEDIVKKLDCVKLFNDTMRDYSMYNDPDSPDGPFRDSRRLTDNANAPLMDDEVGAAGMGNYDYVPVNAKHLFCVAAMQDSPPKAISNSLKCDAAGDKRQALLNLWSSAEAQMDPEMMVKVLSMAKEMEGQTLLGKTYNLWAPDMDNGYTFMLRSLNENNHDNNPAKSSEIGAVDLAGTNKVERGGLSDLHENLGPGKIFVDVGSCLGLTTLVVTQLYPGTKIVSIEPAQPNWLLQQINLRCNLEHDDLTKVRSILSGVGYNSDDEDSITANFLWRPSATTSTRSWTPKDERKEGDLDIRVRLRRLETILAEAGVSDASQIDVLNLDCEGCEYNVVPELSQQQFDSISTILGGVHWGYIPINKLPSSKRGRKTHERLCVHEQIAKTAKECCSVPDLEVRSQLPGEVLKRGKLRSSGEEEAIPASVTVSDLAGNLCDDFGRWAEEHMLNGIEDDYNWFELSGEAQ